MREYPRVESKLPYIIAEAGSCHDGIQARALELVDIARQVGADAVKFQFWSSADELARRRGGSLALRDAYRAHVLPAEWLAGLRNLADSRGLDFIVTAFLPDDVALLAPYVTGFKVSSFEAEAEDLLQAIAAVRQTEAGRNKPVFVSLGMGAARSKAERLLGAGGGPVAFLHCVSAYPTPLSDLNLARIGMDNLSGFSDHSADCGAGALAVAAGAKILEAHLRLDATLQTNPDYRHSLNPSSFEAYVYHARMAALALGDGRDVPQASEVPSMEYRVGIAESIAETGAPVKKKVKDGGNGGK